MIRQEVCTASVRLVILMKWCEVIIGASHSVCSSPCTQVDTMLMSVGTFVINPTFRQQLKKHLHCIVSMIRDLGSKVYFVMT